MMTSRAKQGVFVLLRVWIILLCIVVGFGFMLIVNWVGRIAILYYTQPVVATVQDISNSFDTLTGTVYRHATIVLPDRNMADMELEEGFPPLCEGQSVAVRVVRDTARYDTISELYEVPRIAITTTVLAFLVIPTFWGLHRYKSRLNSIATLIESLKIVIWIGIGSVFLTLGAFSFSVLFLTQ